MKILHLTTHLNIGGISRYVASLSKVLRDRGHTVFVASSGGEQEEALSKNGIRHIYMDIRTKSELSPKVIKSFFFLNSFLKKEKIDLIHAHTRVTQVLSALISRHQKMPYVTTCHGYFKKRFGRRIFGCWGRKVVAISEGVKAQLVRDFEVEEDRIALIRTGIELNNFLKGAPEEQRVRFRHKWNLTDSPVVGTIGRLSPVKGQDVLLRAAKEVVRDFQDTKFLLVGNGPDEKRLKRLSAELGLEKDVIFVDSVDDTKEALSVIDIFVLPSIEEGLGLSLIEAMAFGKPCIASRVGGIQDLIEDGVTGMLFNPGDPNDLARAIKYMFNDAHKRETFKDKARRRVINDFNIEDMASQIEKVYEEVLHSHRISSGL